MQTDRSSQVTIVVGSGNLHKVEEIAAALSDLSDRESRSIRVESIRSLPEGSKPEETGSTFEENALLKARAYAGLALGLPPGRRPRWILADDSGLSVDALRGAPGVLSARYAGEGATDEENNQKLLHALRGVPAGQRGAEFVCVLSLVRVDDLLMCDPLLGDLSRGPAEQAFSVEGRCRGEILPTHQGRAASATIRFFSSRSSENPSPSSRRRRRTPIATEAALSSASGPVSERS